LQRCPRNSVEQFGQTDDASGFRFTGPRFGGTAFAASAAAGTLVKADEFAAERGVDVAFIPRVVAHIPSREKVDVPGDSENFGARLRPERLEDPHGHARIVFCRRGFQKKE
jgi:hypothetical protein